MDKRSIRAGDIVRADVRGGRFWARVSAPMRNIDGLGERITLEPLEGMRGVLPAEWVTGRQVVGHWGQRSGSKV